jgi:hypothetical protein
MRPSTTGEHVWAQLAGRGQPDVGAVLRSERPPPGSSDQSRPFDQHGQDPADLVPARPVHAAMGRTPESFLPGATGDHQRFALPGAGPDRRLRWALKLLYASMDEKRGQDGLTWPALATVMGCGPNQLTYVRTAKYATNMDLAMRIVHWLGRPAADFVYPAGWCRSSLAPGGPRYRLAPTPL